MKNGTQIIYVPYHIDIDNIYHEDTEFGFVYDDREIKDTDFIFCRYWSKTYSEELRTKSCGEATPIHRLVVQNTRDQQLIWDEIEKIKEKYDYTKL